MTATNPAIADAVARLDRARDALATARIPYNAALDERDAALRDPRTPAGTETAHRLSVLRVRGIDG